MQAQIPVSAAIALELIDRLEGDLDMQKVYHTLARPLNRTKP